MCGSGAGRVGEVCAAVNDRLLPDHFADLIKQTWEAPSMHLVENYWGGVQLRLQAEVEGFNSLISHQGEKGRENELSFARLLGSLVPSRYGVGAGLIFDRAGEESSQTDIILYDAIDEPAVLAQTNQVLFPVENVRGAIEVKTKVGKDEIEDIGDKVASVRRLAQHPDWEAPLTMAVGYKARQHPKTLVGHVRALPPQSRPDLFLILDPAIIGISPAVASGLPGLEDDRYLIGVVPVQKRDDSGAGRIGEYESPRQSDSKREECRGVNYGVHETDSGPYLAESARALLLFAEALTTSLALRDGRRRPGFHHYVTPAMRDVLLVD